MINLNFWHEPAILDISETESEDSSDSESSVALTKDSIDHQKLY